MISIQKQFLFIHVPKTGGNSIQNILMHYSEDDVVALPQHRDEHGFEQFQVKNSKHETDKHFTLSQYKNVLDKNAYRSLYKFATIRNPWDMLVSHYFSPHWGGDVEWDRTKFVTLIKKRRTLRQFISTRERSLSERALAKIGLSQLVKQSSLVSDIDFLIRFEKLDEDFAKVCNQLGIEHVALSKRNASTRSHYSKYYDEESIELVAKRFAEEIAYGGYTFEKA